MTPARRRRRAKTTGRGCSSNRSKLLLLFIQLPLIPILQTLQSAAVVSEDTSNWASHEFFLLIVSVCFCFFVCVDNWTGGQRNKEKWGRGMKKLSLLGICSIPVILRCISMYILSLSVNLSISYTHTHTPFCPLRIIISVLSVFAFLGRPTSVEWVSRGSADRVWEVRVGQEGYPLWCEFNVFMPFRGLGEFYWHGYEVVLWLCLCCRDTRTAWHLSPLRSRRKPMRAFSHLMVAGSEDGSSLFNFGMDKQTIRYTNWKFRKRSSV